MSRSKLLVLGAASIWLAGCSFINAPNRSRFQDGGADVGMDGDAGDSGDGDAGTGDACVPRPEECSTRVDEDCDFLIDCADPDCASLEECCEGGTTDSTAWNEVELMNFWVPLPTAVGNYPEFNMGELTAFPSSTQGVLRIDCVPLAAGYQLSTTVFMNPDGCPEGGCFAGVVFTPAPGAGPGMRILEDLGVTVDTTGRVSVTNAGRVLGGEDALVSAGQLLTVTITVTVGVDGADRQALLATVTTLNMMSLSTTTLVEGVAFSPVSSLLTVADCDEVAGLRLAIEGSGSQFKVGPLTETPLECTNASRFETPRRDSKVLTAADVSGETVDLHWGEWSSRGIGSPAIAVEDVAGDIAWHVVGDGTNFDRTQNGPLDLGFGIGYSKSRPDDWGGTWLVGAETEPKMGPCHPSCIGVPPAGCCLMPPFTSCTDAMCPSEGAPPHSVRDPSFGVMPISGGTTRVAYARRISADEYGIAFALSFRLTDFTQTPGMAEIRTGDVPGDCVSLRDPMLAPVDPENVTGEQWLFYSCYKDVGVDRAEIHAVRLNRDLQYVDMTHRVIVSPSMLGAWAGASVWSPELVVEYEPMGGQGRHLYRLWFLARNSTRERASIGLLQGQLSVQQAAGPELPDFEPFGANPVLTEGPTAFRGCADCLIHGLAVVRVTNTDTIRFLFALQANAGVADDWHYAPYNQFWRSPWTTR